MKVHLTKKLYRSRLEYTDIIKSKLRDLLIEDVSDKDILDALWDCNPYIYYNRSHQILKFQPHTLAAIIKKIKSYYIDSTQKSLGNEQKA